MHALKNWPREARRRITGVLTDIDDTLTTAGAITPDALDALGTLKPAGLSVIAVTGRSSGWSKPFALEWPVDAIVAENGAVAFLPYQKGLSRIFGERELLLKVYQQDEPTRTSNFRRMQSVLGRIERELPGVHRATDSPGRETDIAIDHSEFARLSQAQIAAVVALMKSQGMQATVSSIHVNRWYGGHNKLAGARWIVRELLGRDLDAEMPCWAFVGDSTNDELMFEAFPNSIGVANLRRFEAQLSHPPRYITVAERGAGFAEVAAAVLAARTGQHSEAPSGQSTEIAPVISYRSGDPGESIAS